ncbi:hypothetical protein [Bacillus massilinigeriensis]|uniref:hypothetical protein n=1 Tax=Bacillus massilionigeriensis TaxID=1805475 RepID=UPI00096B411B|nr:hypothetical protein [Bacillus massilionigeriensis]
MQFLFIGLLAFSVLLFIISIFAKDPVKALREEIDQLSMQQLQELYQIKKKMKVLEEELLVSEGEMSSIASPGSSVQSFSNGKKQIHEIIKNQVISLAGQGLSIDQISKQSSLSKEDVQAIIQEYMGRGN